MALRAFTGDCLSPKRFRVGLVPATAPWARSGIPHCNKSASFLLDDLVGSSEQHGRDFDADRPRSDQIDSEIELSRLLDRNIGGLRAA